MSSALLEIAPRNAGRGHRRHRRGGRGPGHLRHRLDRLVSRRAVVVGLVAGTAWGTGLGLAAASFLDSGVASHSISSATVAAPSGLSASNGTCLVGVSTQVNLSWTPTTSTWADGHQVLRSTTNGGPYTVIASVAGASSSSYADTTAAFSTTYYYRVRAYDGSTWQSVPSSQVTITTPSSLCIL